MSDQLFTGLSLPAASGPNYYKLKPECDAPAWALDTTWEQEPMPVVSRHREHAGSMSAYVYLPSGGNYQFKYAHATLEASYEDWTCQQGRPRWKLECWDNPPRLSWGLSSGDIPTWESGQLASVMHNDNLVLLKSDIGYNHLLVEKQFVEQVTPTFVPNKWNLPIKLCQIKMKDASPLLRPEPNMERAWCEVHGDWVHNQKCSRIVPNEYLPCDVESDQGGDYCQTHGVMPQEDFSNICQEYRGPKIWGKHEDYHYDNKWIIPRFYITCDHYRGATECYTHSGVYAPGEVLCDKYDGPLNIQPIIRDSK